MEANMLITDDGEDNFAIYLVYKLDPKQKTSIRQFLDVKDTREEAEIFANSFISTLTMSGIIYQDT